VVERESLRVENYRRRAVEGKYDALCEEHEMLKVTHKALEEENRLLQEQLAEACAHLKQNGDEIRRRKSWWGKRKTQ
jgi:hypothetical protein